MLKVVYCYNYFLFTLTLQNSPFAFPPFQVALATMASSTTSHAPSPTQGAQDWLMLKKKDDGGCNANK